MNINDNRLLEKIFSNLGKRSVRVEQLRQGWGTMCFNCDISGDKGIFCGDIVSEKGIWTHADSRIRIHCPGGAAGFQSICGIASGKTMKGRAAENTAMYFSVETPEAVLFKSPLLKFGQSMKVDIKLPENCHYFDLAVHSPQGDAMAQAAWADPTLIFDDQTSVCIDHAGAAFDGLPVSFRFGGLPSSIYFARNPISIRKESPPGKEQFYCACVFDGIKMESVFSFYHDYPVCEWHTTFENISEQRSAKLSEIRTADFLLPYTGTQKQYTLIRRRGALHDPEDQPVRAKSFLESFKKVEQPARTLQDCRFGAVNGRPSVDFLPFFDLTDGKENYRLAVGWAGQWCAELGSTALSLHCRAGLEDFDSVLDPGEKISTPSIFFQTTAAGGNERAINVWRRFVTQHVMMPHNGKAPVAPAAFNNWGGWSEKDHLKRIDLLEKHQIPYELYWIDAGWYAPNSENVHAGVWCHTVGDWQFDRTSYPDELKNIRSRLTKNKRQLLLWQEPERVGSQSRLIKKQVPWLLLPEKGAGSLLDLGDPEAWKLCWETTAGLIRNNRIDWYRPDFNMEPLEYWRSKDTPDRKGMTEMRYVEGLYRFWRELRETFPGLMVDNIASGGRRLDPELLRYSLPLWNSDMQCYPEYDPDYALVQNSGLAVYWPRFSSGQCDAPNDTYAFRAGMNNGITPAFHKKGNLPVTDEYPYPWLRKNMQQFLSIREFFAGDYYCLLEAKPWDNTSWAAFEYLLPEKGSAVITVFRPRNNPAVEYCLKPRGLEPDAIYSTGDLDGLLEPFSATGAILMENGIRIRLEKDYSSAVVTLNKQQEK